MNEAFESFWENLTDYYGKKFNPSVTFEYKRETDGVPASKKNELYRHIVHTYDFFPKLSEFSAACAKFKPQPKQVEYNERCVYCLGSGLIRYNRKVKGLSYDPEYFAACVCPKGRSFKSKHIFGVEEVWKDKTEAVLKQLAEKNTPRKSVSELQQDIARSFEIMDMRSQSFKRGTAV